MFIFIYKYIYIYIIEYIYIYIYEYIPIAKITGNLGL